MLVKTQIVVYIMMRLNYLMELGTMSMMTRVEHQHLTTKIALKNPKLNHYAGLPELLSGQFYYAILHSVPV